MKNNYAAQERRKKAVDLIWINSVPDRWEEAVSLLREAIEMGDIESYYYLGRCYVWGDAGLGTIGSQKEGIRLYKEGAALGSSLCVIGLERAQELKENTIAECLKSPVEAFTNVMDMALNSDPFPCYLIGNAYYFCDVDTYSYMPNTMSWDQKERLWKQEAKRWFLKAAKLGVSFAMNNMAVICEDEDNDPKTAMYYLQMAAAQNRGTACINIGRFYEKGIGVKKDKKQALVWYQKGAELRDVYCLWRVGSAWQDGEFGKEDNEKAHRYFLEALKMGSSYAAASLGQEYECGWGVKQNYAKAVEYYLLDLEAEEDSQVPLHLGDIFSKGGYGVEQDLELAWKYYKQAANMKNAKATERLEKFNEVHPEIADRIKFLECQRNYEESEKLAAVELAQFYMGKLDGAPKHDCTKALDLLEEALQNWDRDQGREDLLDTVFECLTSIGNGFMNGEGKARALDILENAYKKDLKGAGLAIALVLRETEVPPEEKMKSPIYKRAIHLLEQEIKQGNSKAYNWLGGMYLNGNGVKAELEKAINILMNGVKAGSPDCAEGLAKIYSMGVVKGRVGIKRDYKKAITYAKKAVEGGCTDSYVILGTFYCFGKGVWRNREEARKYFLRGYKHKNAKCAMKLAWMLRFKSIMWDSQAKKQRFKYYLDAFKWGEPTALPKVAEAYLCGDGVEMNETLGIELLKKSVTLGSRKGAEWLASCYQKGIGVEKDKKKAKEYRELSKRLPNE